MRAVRVAMIAKRYTRAVEVSLDPQMPLGDRESSGKSSELRPHPAASGGL